MEAHPVIVEAHPVAIEAHSESTEAHSESLLLILKVDGNKKMRGVGKDTVIWLLLGIAAIKG
jgi:hypothetical protein